MSNVILYNRLFRQAKPIRSKTVFVIKNLAPNSDKTELRERLAGHGALARVVWPPSGVTVLVEYDSPAEARSAFKAFAYSQVGKIFFNIFWNVLNLHICCFSPRLD